MIPLTQHELKELLHYDQGSGLFTWKVFRCRSAKPGDVAGKTNHQGYRVIKIYGKYYHASRLVWLYVYGRHPDGEIDHINRVRNDNRIVNLREVSHRENSMNRGVRSDNKSGSKGYAKTLLVVRGGHTSRSMANINIWGIMPTLSLPLLSPKRPGRSITQSFPPYRNQKEPTNDQQINHNRRTPGGISGVQTITRHRYQLGHPGRVDGDGRRATGTPQGRKKNYHTT